MPVSRRHRVGLEPIWNELAARVSRGDKPVRLTLTNLSDAEQSAIADLLGRERLAGSRLRLSVDRLAVAIGVDGMDELIAIAEEIVGPIPDRPARRAAAALEREELWQWLSASLTATAMARSAGVLEFVAAQRAMGVPNADVEARRALFSELIAVVDALPADSVGLAAFAADVLGDPHALDRDRALGRLTPDAIALLRGRPSPTDPEDWRRTWLDLGVSPDAVSSTVLSLGLAPEPGEPMVLTLRQLELSPLAPLAPGARAFVVENPSIIEAAADAGLGGDPLICSAGQATIAVRLLLRQLGAAGATIFQHADFDPSGVAITNWFRDNAGTTPWLMDADSYERAASQLGPGALRITAPVPPTNWDPRLADAMTRIGVVVSEEQVRHTLLAAIAPSP